MFEGSRKRPVFASRTPEGLFALSTVLLPDLRFFGEAGFSMPLMISGEGGSLGKGSGLENLS